MDAPLLAIVGPTASGKTGRAVDCARRFDGEIISGDSRQIYRGMTIGSGKDLEEYGEIPYHLIDICPAGEKYNLHRFIKDFHYSLDDIRSRMKYPILCGGTGLYVESVLSGIRLPDVPRNDDLRKHLSAFPIEKLKEILEKHKQLHNITDLDSPSRAIRAIEIQKYYEEHPEIAEKSKRCDVKPLDSVIVGVDIDRESRRKRITERLISRMNHGMPEEIQELLNSGISPEDLMYYGLEYKYVTLYVLGRMTREEMMRQLEIAIHQFAKRQMTWFRGMERRGFPIHWVSWKLSPEKFTDEVERLIKR